MKKRKVNRYAKQRNAIFGARVTWCPKCKRKAALSSWPGRTCRYCGHKEHRKWSERKVLLEAWEAGEPEESPADIVVNRFVWLLQWATQNAGQRYRLKKAAAAWLAENDDGKEKLDVLAERFVATHDIDAIVARPKHPITAVATGHNVVLFFRGEETPDYTLVVKREETMRWAQCLLDILDAYKRRPIRVQYVDIFGVARVWIDGKRGNQEICETQAEARLLSYVFGKVPDEDYDQAIEDGRLPNKLEDFRLEIIELDEPEGLGAGLV